MNKKKKVVYDMSRSVTTTRRWYHINMSSLVLNKVEHVFKPKSLCPTDCMCGRINHIRDLAMQRSVFHIYVRLCKPFFRTIELRSAAINPPLVAV